MRFLHARAVQFWHETVSLAFGSDVAVVHDVLESCWLDYFNAFVRDPVRASSSRSFYERLLFGLPASGFQGHTFVMRVRISMLKTFSSTTSLVP